MLFKHFLTRAYIFWPLVKLFCLRGEDFVIERKTTTNFSNWKYRLGDMLSQISFFLPSLSLCSCFIFLFQALSSPSFFRFSLPKDRSCLTVNSFLLVFLSPCHTLEGLYIFPLGHLQHVAAWRKSLHLFLCDWQAGSLRYEEEQKYLFSEDLWHPCAWVSPLAAVTVSGNPYLAMLCLLHKRLHFFLGLKMAVQTY